MDGHNNHLNKSPGQEHSMFKLYYKLRLLSLICVVLAALPTGATAVESYISVSSGYNDNINLLNTPEGESFVTTVIDFSHQNLFTPFYGETRIYLNMSYTQPSESDSNMDASIGGHYSFYPANRFMMLGFCEIGAFRNNEEPLDDFNRVTTGGEFRYHYSDKLSFSFLQRLRWRNFVEPFVYETTGATIDDIITVSESQDDLLLTSDAGMEFVVQPWLTLRLNGFFSHLDSSVSYDIYNETGARSSIKISHNRTWYVIVDGGRFTRSFANSERKDTLKTAGIIISRTTGIYEVFLESAYSENSSSYAEESYKQKVIQCGVSLFF